MDHLPQIDKVIESLSKLPSVGKKSAERIAYSLLDMDEEEVKTLINDIEILKSSISYCPICGAYKEEENCEYCSNDSRDRSVILVVSNPKDIFSFEKSEEYHGLYHVLNGVIQTSKGIGPDQLNIASLVSRIEKENIKEVIIATNPTLDGETTALYISKILEPLNVEVTRLAYGLQMGGNLDYVDAITLSKAIEGRRKI
ncbi:MAG: recombination mediator RecR [Bacilli bacterium]